jgi:hypothetical protein
MGSWGEIKSFLLPTRIGTSCLLTHTFVSFTISSWDAESIHGYRISIDSSWSCGLLLACFFLLVGYDWAIQRDGHRIGLRGVFRYCVSWKCTYPLSVEMYLSTFGLRPFQAKRTHSVKL